MVDTIIKGTGNSRSIKSVPNLAALAPTYEALLALLTGDGLPVDIGGLNPTGVQVAGTDLTKETLLTDETAALYGLTAEAVPNDVLGKARALITEAKNAVRVEAGTYIGDGEKTKIISFQFKPQIVTISRKQTSPIIFYQMVAESSCPIGALFMMKTSSVGAKIYDLTWGSSSISITTRATNEFPYHNATGETYYYHAIG